MHLCYVSLYVGVCNSKINFKAEQSNNSSPEKEILLYTNVEAIKKSTTKHFATKTSSSSCLFYLGFN